MTTTNGNRAILDLARWEFCTPCPSTKNTGALIISSRGFRQQQLYINSASSHFMYHPNEDAWIQIPSGGLGGTYGAGICGTSSAVGPSGTATAGTTSTITTNLTLARDLRGYKIHITGGTNNRGLTLNILSNTVGSNSVITVATQGSAFDNTTTYRLLTPRFYVWNAGTTSATSFRVYDYATNAWTSLSQTGPSSSWGTDAKLIATPSFIDNEYVSFDTFTATGNTNVTNATITCTGKTWATSPVGQWTNFQVRVVSGTGAGQIKRITSNTADTLTLDGVWATALSTDSVISIEGNDDFLYLIGNNSTAMNRYSISNNSWSTPAFSAPSPARANAPSTGMSGHWVWGCTESDWTNVSAIKNGRYIYSFRGGATVELHRYDIAANGWETITYSPNVETFTTGTTYAYYKNHIYIQKESTGRWFKYAVARNEMIPWSTNLYPPSTAQIGDTSWDVVFKDGSTEIGWIYTLLNNSVVVMRCPVISP
jgi:hypothetical protein